MINNMDNNIKLVLDTYVLICYAEGITLSDTQVQLIEEARRNNSLYISAISILEIAMLANKGILALSVSLTEWLNKLLAIPNLNLLDLSTTILIESCSLPAFEHQDLADRLIIAATRDINGSLLTFDQRIIDYGDKGYLKILS